MRIRNLTLHNFRNYENETFSFDDGINVLVGRNGQGKTNCAEAIFYLCTGASLRIKHDRQLIRIGQTAASLRAQTESRFGKILLEADIYENKRELKLNGAKVSRSVDFLGNMKSVFFSPGELRVVQDGPDERRRFLNLSISQTSRPYAAALLRYHRILDQRNNLLKERDVSLVLETLPVWDEQLARYAAILIRARALYLKKLAPFAADAHAFLTDGAESLSLAFENDYPNEENDIAQEIARELENAYERDLRLGYTSVGPHRDDIKISINGIDARNFASQGQTRTAALALKLAELEIFREIAGEPPILILDDVMSELDLQRRRKLIERMQGIQCILTCTHAERLIYGKDMKKFKIREGKIL